jgi:hypothetical protein
MSTYNGWTNYATWRVNLEIFDGLDVEDMGWNELELYDMAQAFKEYANEVIEMGAQEGLALDYARAFLSDVDWYDIAKHYVVEQSDDELSAEDIGVLEQSAWHDTSAELL